jgi:hypothetical protein
MEFLTIIEIGILAIIAWMQWDSYRSTRLLLISQYSIFPSDKRLGYRLITGVFGKAQPETIEANFIQKHIESNSNHNYILFFQKTGEETPSDFSEIKMIGGYYPNTVYCDIQKDLNIYLVRNQNKSTDFKVIQDILDRHCQINANNAESTISLPLYYGLLGTIIGIIFGSFYISIIGAEDSTNVVSLLRTVGLAMSVSGLGLLLTVRNINLQKNVTSTLENGKNGFLTFVQAELLPVMRNDIEQSLQTMQRGLNLFNDRFQKNLEVFDSSLEKITENLSVQKTFLIKLDQIGFNQMVKETVGIFEQLSNSADSLREFRKYQDNVTHTLGTLEKTINGFETLYNRTENFEQSLNLIAENIGKQDDTYQKLMVMLDENSSEIDERKESLRRVIDGVDAFFKEQYNALSVSAQEQNKNLISLNDNHISQIQGAYEQLQLLINTKTEELKKTAEREVFILEENYRNKKQSFDALDRLPKLEQSLTEINKKLNKLDHSDTLIEVLNRLNENIDKSNIAQSDGILTFNWQPIKRLFIRNNHNSNGSEEKE